MNVRPALRTGTDAAPENAKQLLFQCALKPRMRKKKKGRIVAIVSEASDRRVRRPLEGQPGPSREDSMEPFHLSAVCLRSSRRLASLARE